MGRIFLLSTERMGELSLKKWGWDTRKEGKPTCHRIQPPSLPTLQARIRPSGLMLEERRGLGLAPSVDQGGSSLALPDGALLSLRSVVSTKDWETSQPLRHVSGMSQKGETSACFRIFMHQVSIK